jgi:hypothetical protein
MKLFISWSGEASKTVANALRDWITLIINDVQPWVSDEDIAKGAHWPKDLQQELRDARFGVICITPQNVSEPWVLFEAGALSKAIDQADVRVCPYLLGLETTDLRPPLGHFSAAKADRADTLKLVRSINDAVKASDGLYLPTEKIELAFNMWWPDLEKKLAAIPVAAGKTPKRRDEREILEEILELVRSLSRSQMDREALKQVQEVFRGLSENVLASLKEKLISESSEKYQKKRED